jgi:hypothetical protein
MPVCHLGSKIPGARTSGAGQGVKSTLHEMEMAFHNGDVAGAEPEAYDLRVTTVFRREDGNWKIVHRHADPMPDSDTGRRQLTRF